MARSANGTNEHIYSDTISPLTSAYSYSFLYKSPRAPANISPVRHPFSLVDGTGTYDVNFAWDHSAATTFRAAVHRESGGAIRDCQIPFGLDPNTWYLITVTWAPNTLRVYLNGVLVRSVAATAPSGAVNPRISFFSYNAGATGLDDGTMAEFGLWSVELTQDDVTSLARGCCPAMVRTDALVAYSDLVRDPVMRKGPALTAVGTSPAEHPRVIHPSQVDERRLTNNATYVVVMSGGLVLGASFTTQVNYTHTMSGGLVLGRSFELSQLASFSDTLNLNEDGPAEVPHLRSQVALTATFRNPEPYVQLNSTLRFTSEFFSDIGELANGRAKAKTGND